MSATDPKSLADCVVDCLNGAGIGKLTSLCSPGVTVFAPITEESLDPFAKRDPSKVAEFVTAFRAAFPDLRASSAGVESGASAVTVKWSASGTHRKALGYIQPSGLPVSIRGTCALKLEGGQVSEIRLAADIYDLLVQTGAICADPAQVRGQAAAVNRTALEALRKAITSRSADVGAPFDKDTILHAAVRFYASSEFEQKSFDVAGANQFATLLAFLRAQFSGIELALDDGLSQGHTTTFRGKARVVRAGERYSYMFRSGFRSSGTRIVDAWVELQVPPTLREAFEMSVSQMMMPYSLEGFLTDPEVERIVQSIDAYKKTVDPKRLAAGATGYTIHNSENLSVPEIISVYEPAGRLDVNWQEIPRDIVEIVEAAFFRRIEDVRRAFPTAYGPYGFTYVEYGPGQFFTAHIDGVSRSQVCGFGVTLTNDFEGGEFSVETCGSGRLWAADGEGRLQNAPGHDAQSAWYRALPRTRWTTRPVRGNAVFYGSGLTHSSLPVTKGILRKVIAFVRSH